MPNCERCTHIGLARPATARITYGLYSAHKAGRPHNVIVLCRECSSDLYNGNGCVPLKNLVTTGLCHFQIEPL
jgi:ATP-dependent exoDNAse (exonuclease V) alpha subunit